GHGVRPAERVVLLGLALVDAEEDDPVSVRQLLDDAVQGAPALGQARVVLAAGQVQGHDVLTAGRGGGGVGGAGAVRIRCAPGGGEEGGQQGDEGVGGRRRPRPPPGPAERSAAQPTRSHGREGRRCATGGAHAACARSGAVCGSTAGSAAGTAGGGVAALLTGPGSPGLSTSRLPSVGGAFAAWPGTGPGSVSARAAPALIGFRATSASAPLAAFRSFPGAAVGAGGVPACSSAIALAGDHGSGSPSPISAAARRRRRSKRCCCRRSSAGGVSRPSSSRGARWNAPGPRNAAMFAVSIPRARAFSARKRGITARSRSAFASQPWSGREFSK